MTDTNKKLIFMPTKEEKKIIEDCCHEVINVITKHCNNHFGMKVFTLKTLIGTFEETYNVDLMNMTSLVNNKDLKED